MLNAMLNLVWAQGMCPMCAGMGVWMILFWVVLIAVIVGVVWMLTRQLRR